jgi:hypothetical protein
MCQLKVLYSNGFYFISSNFFFKFNNVRIFFFRKKYSFSLYSFQKRLCLANFSSFTYSSIVKSIQDSFISKKTCCCNFRILIYSTLFYVSQIHLKVKSEDLSTTYFGTAYKRCGTVRYGTPTFY